MVASGHHLLSQHPTKCFLASFIEETKTRWVWNSEW